jgi:hypothetical protein
VDEPAPHEIEGDDEKQDGGNGEREGGGPGLVPDAVERVHAHRDHNRPVAAVLTLERYRDEVEPDRVVGVGDELSSRHGLVPERDRAGRRWSDGAGHHPPGSLLRGGDGDRPDRGHGLAVVREQILELRGRRQRRVLAEVGGDAEGDRGRGVHRLGFDRAVDDPRLQKIRHADDGRDDERGGQAEAGAE